MWEPWPRARPKGLRIAEILEPALVSTRAELGCPGTRCRRSSCSAAGWRNQRAHGLGGETGVPHGGRHPVADLGLAAIHALERDQPISSAPPKSWHPWPRRPHRPRPAWPAPHRPPPRRAAAGAGSSRSSPPRAGRRRKASSAHIRRAQGRRIMRGDSITGWATMVSCFMGSVLLRPDPCLSLPPRPAALGHPGRLDTRGWQKCERAGLIAGPWKIQFGYGVTRRPRRPGVRK
jgi:hypothetical protein